MMGKRDLIVYVTMIQTLAAGLLVGVWFFSGGGFGAVAPETLAFWFFLSLGAECFWLRTPTSSGMVSMSLAVNLATIFVLPLPYVVLLAGLSVGVSDLILHRRGLIRASFNGSQTMIAIAFTAVVVRQIGGIDPAIGSEFFLREPLAVLAAPVAFFFANTVLVARAIGLDQRTTLWTAWRTNYGFACQVVSTCALFVLGITLVVAIESIGLISGPLYMMFFFIVREAYQRNLDLRENKQAHS